MNEKIDAVIGKGKDTAKAAFDKGNEIMDKVPFLKNPLYKKIAWGVIGALAVIVLFRISGCGSSPSPFEVVRNMSVAMFSGDMETVLSCLYIDGVDGGDEKLAEDIAEKIAQEAAAKIVAEIEEMPESLRAAAIERFKNMKHISTDIKGNVANVVAKISTVEGVENEQTFVLRKVNGEWKMVHK